MDLRATALVFAGGAAGTAARWGTGVLLPVPASGWPVATTVVNLAGALALGALLAALPPRDGDRSGERARLLLGTGFLGAFTTFSALAVETVLLARSAPVLALLHPLLSVVAGIACAAAGAVLVRAVRR